MIYFKNKREFFLITFGILTVLSILSVVLAACIGNEKIALMGEIGYIVFGLIFYLID